VSGARLALDLLLLGGSVYLLWGACRARRELAAWKALQKRTLGTLAEYSELLTTATGLAAKQQHRIAYCEEVLGALGMLPSPGEPTACHQRKDPQDVS
jgi:hypothetical protein